MRAIRAGNRGSPTCSLRVICNQQIYRAGEKAEVTAVKQRARTLVDNSIARSQNVLVGATGTIVLHQGQGQGVSTFQIADKIDNISTVQITWFIRQLRNGQQYVDYIVQEFDATGKLVNSYGGFYPNSN